MAKLMAFLSGKKTYFIAAAAILTAIGSYLGHEIDLQALIAAIFAAIGMMTMRAGITKSGQ